MVPARLINARAQVALKTCPVALVLLLLLLALSFLISWPSDSLLWRYVAFRLSLSLARALAREAIFGSTSFGSESHPLETACAFSGYSSYGHANLVRTGAHLFCPARVCQPLRGRQGSRGGGKKNKSGSDEKKKSFILAKS